MKKQYILLLLAITTTLSLTACGNTSQSASTGVSTEVVLDNTEVETETEKVLETEIVETEVLESTEIEVIESSTQIAFEDVTIENVDEYLASEDFVFVGFNENYKCVKGDSKYEIIDGCYKGVPLKGDTPEKSWTHMVVWVSPGGVEIKINDSYVYLAMKKDIIGREDALWNKDPDKNLEPGSEWMIEASKFAYGESWAKVERQAHGSVDLSELPSVTTATEKRSSFNITDELNAYAEQWSIYNNFKMSGMMEYNIVNMMNITNDCAFVWADGMYKPWRIDREEDYWKITISRNLNDLDWHGLLTCLKNIEPDAELVYDAVYEQFYYGCDWILDYNGWYSISNSNSEIWVTKTSGLGYVEFKIK